MHYHFSHILTLMQCILTLNLQTTLQMATTSTILKPVSVLSAPTQKLGHAEQSRYSVLGRSTTVMRIRSTWNNKWSSPQVGEARYSQVDNRKVSRVTSKRSCMLEGNFKFPTFSRSNNNFFFRIKNLLTNRGIN